MPTAAGVFTVTLRAANTGGTGAATLTLTITPLVTLAAAVASVVAGSGGVGVFTLSLSAAQAHDLIISLIVRGSAKGGVDCVPIKTLRKVRAGKTSVKLKVEPLGEGSGPGDKRIVALRLAPGSGYTVGTPGKVKVKILGPWF